MNETASKQDGTSDTSACNVFAGSDIGYIKGVSFGTKSFRNVNKIEKPNKNLGISCLSWGSPDESVVYAGCKGGGVVKHDVTTGINQFVNLDYSEEVRDLRQIIVHDDNIITGFHNGLLNIHKIKPKGSKVKTSMVSQLNSLDDPTKKNLQCMDHNKTELHMIATGGQENPLRIWDINNLSSDPIFTSKNVRNDWLNLRVPVWVTQAKFYPDSNKVITGTGQGTVRMYDPLSPQRRPVIEVKCEEYPVTALAVRPNSEFQVFVGNTVGTLISLDLRKKNMIRCFKGNKGGITDIKCHPEFPVFAACSVDRYVRCYDPDQKVNILHSMYLNSSLNCILFSSKGDKQDFKVVTNEEETSDMKTEKGGEKENNNNDVLVEEVEEDLWSNMEVVKSKKRRLK